MPQGDLFNLKPTDDFCIIKQNQTNSNQYVILGLSYKSDGGIKYSDGRCDEEENKLNFNLLFQRLGIPNWFPPSSKIISKSELPLLLDIYSMINFTYRYKFSPIPRSIDGPSPINFQSMFRENPLNIIENMLINPDCFNSDIGWGCMIRTGQTLLANTIQRIKYGRNFTLSINDDDRNSDSENDKSIIKLFQDKPEAPFSLHNFVQAGKELSNMKPGQWFGPSATARSIQKLIYDFPQCGINKCIVSVSSGDISKEEIDSIYEMNEDSKILILVGIKLGIHSVNKYYWEDILNLLSTKFSVGIAGGRPSSSLYFFGYERSCEKEYKDSQLLYFDPHRSQPSLNDENGAGDIDYKTCHSIYYGKLKLKDMDPSMLIGILLENLTEWINWQNVANNCKIFNIISSTMNDVTWNDDENIDIESLQSDGTAIDNEQTDTWYNNNDNISNDNIANKNKNTDIQFEESLERNHTIMLKKEHDENMDSNILRQNNTFSSITMDYVDVGSLSYHTSKTLNEAFENIQCKKQKIMIFDQDKSFDRIKDGDIEVEKVLVESDSTEPTTVL